MDVAVNSSGRFVAVGMVMFLILNDGITWATPFKVGIGTGIWLE